MFLFKSKSDQWFKIATKKNTNLLFIFQIYTPNYFLGLRKSVFPHLLFYFKGKHINVIINSAFSKQIWLDFDQKLFTTIYLFACFFQTYLTLYCQY